MSTFAEDWKIAKKQFKARTGGSKPDAKKRGHRSGIGKSLKELDDLSDSTGRTSDAKYIARYNKALSKFNKQARVFLGTLEESILEARQNDLVKTRKRNLKDLKARLDKYLAFHQMNLRSIEGVYKKLDLVDREEARLAPQMRNGVRWAWAAHKAIKAKPTVAVYNQQMEKGARSLTTALKGFLQIQKIKEKRGVPQEDEERRLTRIANDYIDQLKPYADGRGGVDKRTVPEGTPEADILGEMKGFGQLVRHVEADFHEFF